MKYIDVYLSNLRDERKSVQAAKGLVVGSFELQEFNRTWKPTGRKKDSRFYRRKVGAYAVVACLACGGRFQPRGRFNRLCPVCGARSPIHELFVGV